jgi:hypothetical protein
MASQCCVEVQDRELLPGRDVLCLFETILTETFECLASKGLCKYKLIAMGFKGCSGCRVSKPELGLCLQILVSKLKLKKNLGIGHYSKNLPGVGLVARVGDLMN